MIKDQEKGGLDMSVLIIIFILNQLQGS